MTVDYTGALFPREKLTVADVLLPFVFEGADVRGAVVSLDTAWREVLTRHAYPLPVRALLGEAMAASALLSSTLKFDGKLILQTQAEQREAPVRLMVVECNADLGLRAMAKLGAEWKAAALQEGHTLASLVGDGKIVITLDPREPDAGGRGENSGERSRGSSRGSSRSGGTGQAAYQGVVPLEGSHLAAALENYMRRSEQLDTRIFLAADGQRAAGLLIQRLPGEGGHVVPEALSKWPDAQTLAATITADELLSLAPREVMRRLFHEFDLRVFAERPAAFRCTCSRQRVSGMLRALGREEVDGIVREQGAVTVNCEFCNQAYAFDAVDAAQLFAGPLMPMTAVGVRH